MQMFPTKIEIDQRVKIDHVRRVSDEKLEAEYTRMLAKLGLEKPKHEE